MKKQILVLALLSATAVSSSVAFAAGEAASGGTINISGQISDTTCTINGGETVDYTVPLRPISVTEAGDVVGPLDLGAKQITFRLSDCKGSNSEEGTLKMYFSSLDNVSQDGKYLIAKNDKGPVTGIGFALTSHGKNTALDLNMPLDTGIKGVIEKDKVVPYNLDVRYYRTSVAKEDIAVGKFNSSVTYTISYL